MDDFKIGRFASELAQLHQLTCQHGWCEDDQMGCKIIPLSKYIQAMAVASVLAKENPRLDMPIPGVDPKGFIWLTYIDGESRGLALELHDSCYKWTQSNMGDKRTFQSDSLNDVAEAMRTVFPRIIT